jgi:Sulfatase
VARSKTQPAIPGRRFAAKVASPVIIGTAASFASVHTTGRARISTPADAANARANYAAIDCVIAANGWQIPDETLSTIRNPIKSGFKTGITSLRGWRWIRLPGEDDDWQLLNREGKQVARIRQEGELYWVSHPSRLPEPPLEGLGPANMRAELLALWTLEPWSVRAPRLSAKQRALLTAIIRRDHAKAYFDVVNMYEWEGVAGQPAKKGEYITYDSLAMFDVRQADYAIDYIKKHANETKPFFMDVNFMKMHNPTNAAPKFASKSRLGDYSDSLIELDDNIGRIMETIRAVAPNTIVIVTADNGAWQDAYPDAGTSPFRGEKGTAFEGGWRVPGLMWWPGHISAGARYDEMMSHIDCWATLAKMVGLTPPPHGAWTDNNGKPIYFDSIDNSAYTSVRQSTQPEDRGFTSTAKVSWERGSMSEVIRTILISTSRGNTYGPPRTLGSARSRT